MAGEALAIGGGAGFSGDRTDAAGPVVETLVARGGPAALIFETLAERTLALAQIARRQNPDGGYEPQLDRFVGPVLRRCVEHRIPIVGNFGAANPRAAARRLQALARELGLRSLRVGVVEGDDLSDERGRALLAEHLPGGRRDFVSANVYQGAKPIADALRAGAQVVVTGRVADPSLAVGPAMAHYGWAEDDWPALGRCHDGRAPARVRRAGHRRLLRGSRPQGRARSRARRLPDRGGRRRRLVHDRQGREHRRPRRRAHGEGAAPVRGPRSGGLPHARRRRRHLGRRGARDRPRPRRGGGRARPSANRDPESQRLVRRRLARRGGDLLCGTQRGGACAPRRRRSCASASAARSTSASI